MRYELTKNPKTWGFHPEAAGKTSRTMLLVHIGARIVQKGSKHKVSYQNTLKIES